MARRNRASTLLAQNGAMHRRSLIAAFLAGPALAAAGSARAGAPTEKKKGGGLTFIQIPALTATIMRTPGRRGVLTVETGLDVADNNLRERAEASQPRLRAAYLQSLQTYAGGLTVGTAPNADYLARELQRQTDRVLGRAGAKLLLGTILIS